MRGAWEGGCGVGSWSVVPGWASGPLGPQGPVTDFRYVFIQSFINLLISSFHELIIKFITNCKFHQLFY